MTDFFPNLNCPILLSHQRSSWPAHKYFIRSNTQFILDEQGNVKEYYDYYPFGKTLRASITGPEVITYKFTIITPAASSIKVDKSLLIEWTTSKGAYGYIINLINPAVEYPPGSGNYVRLMPASYQTVDTTYSLYRRHGFKKANYVIKIMAYDQNFHYHHAEGISSCGLVGGYGMFGSAAIDSVSFLIE